MGSVGALAAQLAEPLVETAFGAVAVADHTQAMRERRHKEQPQAAGDDRHQSVRVHGSPFDLRGWKKYCAAGGHGCAGWCTWQVQMSVALTLTKLPGPTLDEDAASRLGLSTGWRREEKWYAKPML